MLSENGQDVLVVLDQVTRQPTSMFLIKIVAWVRRLQVLKQFVFQDVEIMSYKYFIFRKKNYACSKENIEL
jgi:hypothetical protein